MTSVVIPKQWTNPFASSVANGTWATPLGSVPDLFTAVVDQFTGLWTASKSQKTPFSLLVRGEAGSGKTHLISQVRNALLAKNSSFLVSIQLETHAGRFWRFVRKHFANDLLKKRWNPKQPELSGLLRILTNRFPRWSIARQSSGGLLGIFGKPPDEELREYLADFSDETPLDPSLKAVLPQLWSKSPPVRDAARDWLADESLPEDRLKVLGLSNQSADEVDGEERAQAVIRSLCQLAASDNATGTSTALVLCFDQVEGMASGLEDQHGLQMYAKGANAILNYGGALLLTTFLRDSFYLQYSANMDGAYRDRLIQNQCSIPQVGFEQAVQLIAYRLQAHDACRAQRAKQGTDPYWPFGESNIRYLVETSTELTPRQVIRQCAVWFQDLQAGKSIAPLKPEVKPPYQPSPETKNPLADGSQGAGAAKGTESDTGTGGKVIKKPDDVEKLADEIAQLWGKRREKLSKSSASLDFDNVMGIGLPWLRELLALPVKPMPEIGRNLAYLNLLFADPTNDRKPLGVSCCNQVPGSLTPRLRKLTNEWTTAKKNKLLSALVVLRVASERRTPLNDTLIGQLREDGARVLLLPDDLFVEVAVYQELFTKSMVGNVTRAGKPISANEYNEWAKKHLTPAVRKFAEDVFGPVPQATK